MENWKILIPAVGTQNLMVDTSWKYDSGLPFLCTPATDVSSTLAIPIFHGRETHSLSGEFGVWPIGLRWVRCWLGEMWHVCGSAKLWEWSVSGKAVVEGRQTAH